MLASIGWFGWAMIGILSEAPGADFVGMGLSIFIFLFVSIGFFMIQPNQGVRVDLVRGI